MNTSFNKKSNLDDCKFHNTKLLLTNYRDIIWSIEISIQHLKNELEEEYGTTIDEYLNTIYNAGISLDCTKLEARSRSIERSNKMIKLIHSSVDTMRKKHKNGETYYWILYYTYLSPQQLKNNEKILQALKAHIGYISRSNYFIKTREAVEVLSSMLWAYTSKSTLYILDELLPEMEVAK